MPRIPVDSDDDMPTAISSDDRARALRWLQENSDTYLDFEVLEERERSDL